MSPYPAGVSAKTHNHGDVLRGGGLPEYPLVEVMTQDGDGSTFNAIIDASVTAAYWEIRPPAGSFYHIHRLLWFILDGSPLSADDYGNISGGLTNGISVSVVRGTGAGASTVYPLTDSNVPIQANHDLSMYMYDMKPDDFGSGDNAVSGRWTFSKFSDGLFLNGDIDEALRITLNDNFTGLVEHCFTVQGKKMGTNQLDGI